MRASAYKWLSRKTEIHALPTCFLKWIWSCGVNLLLGQVSSLGINMRTHAGATDLLLQMSLEMLSHGFQETLLFKGSSVYSAHNEIAESQAGVLIWTGATSI